MEILLSKGIAHIKIENTDSHEILEGDCVLPDGFEDSELGLGVAGSSRNQSVKFKNIKAR